MSCDDFQEQLQQAVESHGPTADDFTTLEAHLQSCTASECHALWTQSELLAGAIRQWQSSVPPVDLTKRVLAELRQPGRGESLLETAIPQHARYRPEQDRSTVTTAVLSSAPGEGAVWMSVGALVATLLLVVSLLTLNRPSPTDIASTRPSGSTPDLLVGPMSADVGPAASSPHRRIGGMYASMPLNATEFLTDAVVLVVPADLSDIEDEPTRAGEWAERLGRQWEPIGRELSSAFEALIEAVPKSSSAS